MSVHLSDNSIATAKNEDLMNELLGIFEIGDADLI